MTRPLTVLCSDPDLAVECAAAAGDVSLDVAPEVTPEFVAALQARAQSPDPIGVLCTHELSPDDLVALAAAAGPRPLGLAMVACGGPRLGLAHDLGLAAVRELGPLSCILALLHAEVEMPWRANGRRLPDADRARLRSALSAAGPQAPTLARGDSSRLVLRQRAAPPVSLGNAVDLAQALLAMRAAHGSERAAMPTVQGVEPSRVADVIFGPPRELSDPSSKAALEPYDLPLPIEELCASASRAAVEAGRIGFPVRVALASPDLRTWDHPDLQADGVTSASGVRDVFRQIMALAQGRRPDARLLGVTVSAAENARALLDVKIRPAGDELALLDMAFADDHGAAADDRIETLLPLSAQQLENAIKRLGGSALLLPKGAVARRRAVAGLRDVLTRLGAFVHDHREAIAGLRVAPLAVLLAGGFEVRYASIDVGDVFVRSLELNSTHAHR